MWQGKGVSISMLGQIRVRLACSVAGLAALAVAGCRQTGVRPPGIASDAGAKAVAKYDANNDGVLDYQELAKAPGLRAAVARVKKLSRPREPVPSDSVPAQPESQRGGYRRPYQRMEETRHRVHLGRLPRGQEGNFARDCRRRGEVRSRRFPRPALTTGTGTTDGRGYAKISQPSRSKDDPNVGMCPGFYRVEITEGNEIPARYNTNTELGQEVASDAVGIATGAMVFELSDRAGQFESRQCHPTCWSPARSPDKECGRIDSVRYEMHCPVAVGKIAAGHVALPKSQLFSTPGMSSRGAS